MPDPSFDVAVANRFISSLSKSLQALCHGCMDFDSGIEIVGYINVNIDCGSKADYVLNEKVLKSTTNTMTFVSNSFLAKKDQPKQTRDGACSPIPQFGAAPYHHRTRGFPHSSYTARSAFHGAHYSRGGQKRGFSGEWRGPMKRPRPLPGDRVSLTQVPSSVLAQDVPTDTFNPSNLRQGQYQQSDAVSTSAGAEGDASMVNIKKEAFEGSDEAQPNQDENSSQQTNDSSELIKNIKSDPDANSPAEEENGSNTKTEATENDFKGTFLQPTQETQDNADAMQTSESGDQTSASEQTVGLETPFPNPPSLSDVADGAGASVMSESVGNFDAGGNELEDRDDNNDATLEYDNATEETSYSEYPDAGEGSSSGQFEVIEIDDEDEDMQAMFGASHMLPQARAASFCVEFKDPLQTKIKLSNKEYLRKYRENIKSDTERYKAYRAVANIRVKRQREKWTDEQKKRNRELQRERQRRYRFDKSDS
ncbi:hypothetical protein PoB_001862800 [Plakobranchus ocellatus]|uniref:Uncharacterized protein n=1 Tax=Plakobranchus ocellatus TaxID=259542 RepID=A0AAV3ZCH7_9GAST|nr:hypothetical protein PoB_001862800 [Plakobranchus ocellatus]